MLFFIFSLSLLPLCFIFFIKIPFFTHTSELGLYFLTLHNTQRLFFIVLIFIFLLSILFVYKTSSFYVTASFNKNLLNISFGMRKFFIDFFGGLQTIGLFLHTASSPVLRWKPLFKKTSYFGLYKANRNRWLNN